MDILLTDEQQAFRSAIREWVDAKASKARILAIDHAEEFPDELWHDMAEIGFHGIGIDEEYGGQGGGVVEQAILAQGLARNLAGLAVMWGASSFAGAKSVGMWGSAEQKERFLPNLAAGKFKFAIAITEPGGGTDVLNNMKTTARRVDGGWELNGQKVWSTGAHVADYILVLAKSHPDEKPTRMTTLFLIPANADGLTMRPIPKVGFKAVASNEVFLDGVFVPDELVLGDPGNGWKMILAPLNNERIITAGFATGIIEGVLEVGLAYLMEREAFGGPIGRFQALQHFVADITSWKVQSELITHYAARLQEAGRPCGTESTMAKLVTAEYASQAADLGIQMLGGMGYSLETDMQRYWRDARLMRIAPITSEMARNMIAEAQGLPRSF